MRCIDSSAIIKYASKEEGWKRLVDEIGQSKTLGLALKELNNALWKKLSKNELDIGACHEILDTYRYMPVFDQNDYLLRALEISLAYRIATYDSLFIAAAEANGLELVTCDRKQAEVARALGVKSKLY